MTSVRFRGRALPALAIFVGQLLAACATNPAPAARTPAATARPACVPGGEEIVAAGVPAHAPVAGAREQALVTIVAFMDYQCPFCARAADTMERLLERHPNTLRLVFRHLPLPFHSQALPAARAAVAAGRQGRFWEMSRELFANTRRLDEQLLFELARRLELDPERFQADFSDPATLETIEHDRAAAERLGVRGTPVFFVNGREVRGARPLEYFEELLGPLLDQARAAGGRGDELYRRLVACGVTERRSAPPRSKAPAPAVAEQIYPVEIGQAPVLGGDQARVEIVVFADFQCPYCARLDATLRRLQDHYGDKLRLVFKHFPLPFHRQAQLAHEAAAAAGAQGRFWEMAGMLYANQRRLEPQDLEGYAAALELDRVRFAADLAHHRFAALVQADIEQGKKLEVRGTPTMFINGRKVVGARSYEQLQELITGLLEEPAARATGQAAPGGVH